MASCSTSSSSLRGFKYDVFLSFRGEDVRKNIVDHLFIALKGAGLNTFKDDEKLEVGSEINSALLQAIEDSHIYIIVFSTTYASSGWCLNELVKIMECTKMSGSGHTTYPVFVDVEPTEVRNQTGAVAAAFAKHVDDANALKWREALTAASNLAGLSLKDVDDGHQGKFVQRIVKRTLDLHPVKILIDHPVVGMERRMEAVLASMESDIDEPRMIGITGMGGLGKSTLAKAVFNRVSTRFEATSFVENIREKSKLPAGLESLQEQIIFDLSNRTKQRVHGQSNGRSQILRSLQGKKVLIVLDDVSQRDQLEALSVDLTLYKAGSRILITTRNQLLLSPYDMPIHEVDLLSDEEAKGLFNSLAFKGGIPTQGYEQLCDDAVRSADGLPLHIRHLSSLLHGKDKPEWRDYLDKLKTIPLEETYRKLEVSYVDLMKDLQDIFLDVACFLKGSHKEEAIRLLNICGSQGRTGLSSLKDRCLITFSSDQHLDMHDLLQCMGRYIVQSNCLDDPSKHSRLWECDKVEEILNNEEGSAEAKAIALTECLTSQIVAKGFGNIKNLRFLRVISESDEITHHDSRYFPSTLRYLSWESYPYGSLPSKFQPNNLVALEMRRCKIKRLWEGDESKVLRRLKFLVLSHSELTFLDLDLTPDLEKLDLEGCLDLKDIRVGKSCLQKLVSLNLNGCSSINSLSFVTQLKALEILHLSSLSLEKFPDILSDNMSLLEFHFRENNIEELPSSIGELNLVVLDLHGCTELGSLPRSICDLQDLKFFGLGKCILKELPGDFGKLKCLENLDLSHTQIKHLPDNFTMLLKLTTLNLSYCSYLEKLPEDLSGLASLEKVILTECRRIEYIPDSICQLKNLKCLNLLKCGSLEDLPEGLEYLECLKELYVAGTRIQLPPAILSLQNLKSDQASSISETLKASSPN